MSDNKVALVTGASRGIGKACALELARRGCDIAVNYCDLGSVKQALNDLDSAWFFFRKSMELQQQAGNDKGIAKCHFHYGELYECENNFAHAIKEYTIAYDELKKMELYPYTAAVEAGIPVINFDTPVDEGENGGYGDLAATIIASDNYNAGYVCGADVAEKFDGQHIKILVAHSPRATSCTRRYAGFFAALDEAGADYEIVQEVDGWGDREKSLNAVAPALVADPDIDVIFAINDPSAMGCYDAVEQATVELEKDILIYGVDGNPDIKQMIKDGQVEGTGSQSPNTLGFDSMVAAFKILNGEEVEHKIDVDTFLITAENVDEFGTDGWQ